MTQVDLSKPTDGYKVIIQTEEHPHDRIVRLFKEVVLFLSAVFCFGLILFICFDVVQNTVASANEKKWAMSVLTGLTGALTGYLLKK
jgi:hypothetical protein